MGRKKTHSVFIKELEKVWKGEFELIEGQVYKGYKKYLQVKHVPCGETLNKTPKNLIVQQYGCKICENQKNGKGRRKNTNWFIGQVKKLVGDEYTVKSQYIRSKDPITMYHKLCGQEFETTPDAFLGNRDSNEPGRKCSLCSGKWARDTEDFKKEVYAIYKDEFEVIGTYKNRHQDIDILHKVCGNISPVRPRHFLDGNSYCRFCNLKEIKDTKRFKEQVYQLVTNEYKVLGEYVDAKTPISIEHKVCGNINDVTPDNFLRGRRCKHCSDSRRSKGMALTYKLLLLNGLYFDREYRDYRCKNIKPLPFDFAIYKDFKMDELIAFIEIDGRQHEEPIEYWGGEEGFIARKNNDKTKDNFAHEREIPLIRIRYIDSYDLLNLPYKLKSELGKIGIKIQPFQNLVG